MGVDYSFEFPPITEMPSQARFCDYGRGRDTKVPVWVDDNSLIKCGRGVRSEIADLIDVAVAVHIADRLARPFEHKQRRISVVLPVRNADLLSASKVQELLSGVLFWLTDDTWEFQFVQRRYKPRSTELATPLRALSAPDGATEVALWSGGLDSLAGLLGRILKGSATSYLLVGTGGNNLVMATQRTAATALVESLWSRHDASSFAVGSAHPDADTFLQNVTLSSVPAIGLMQLPIHMTGTDRINKNSSPRARGFVFALMGAACALMKEQVQLNVYENGPGAINLPYSAAEVGVDHSRSVHPLTLARISELVSEVVNAPFSIQNPYVFQTKVQMCEAIALLGLHRLVEFTVTCDSTGDRRNREPGDPLQCGKCSSCLLRRQALAASGVEDATSYYVTEKPARDTQDAWQRAAHLRAMLEQVSRLRMLLASPNSWTSMCMRYPVLQLIAAYYARTTAKHPDEGARQIIELYNRYVTEWGMIEPALGEWLTPSGLRSQESNTKSVADSDGVVAAADSAQGSVSTSGAFSEEMLGNSIEGFTEYAGVRNSHEASHQIPARLSSSIGSFERSNGPRVADNNAWNLGDKPWTTASWIQSTFENLGVSYK